MSEKFQLIHVRLKPRQHEKLMEIQERDGISLSEQIRIAVSKYLRGF